MITHSTIKTLSVVLVMLLSVSTIPSRAQIDDNKTFYHRTDGGVTVVDPDRNIFGNTEYKVRTYDSRDSAYQSEYAVETAIAAIAIIAVVEVGKAIHNWWQDEKASWKSAPRNSKAQWYPKLTSVSAGGIGASIGLKAGDFIVSYNGKSLGYATRANNPLKSTIETTDQKAYPNCEIVIWRNGELLSGTVPGGELLGVSLTEEPIPQR